MDTKYFIGTDVSQDTLDFALVIQGKVVYNQQVKNNLKGIQAFIKTIKKSFNFNSKTTLFCMEHTGVYNNILLGYLIKQNSKICLESSLQIKHSLGMQRGKNDKIDAQRIAIYAYKNEENIKFWEPPRAIILELKQFAAIRNRLLGGIYKLQTPITASKAFLSKKEINTMQWSCKASISALKKDVKKIEKQIKELIKNDEHIQRLYNILTSINGIGIVTAAELIVTTNEFKKFENAKKFACYAGVVPFEYRSGTSIRGKSRVSQMANKSVKKLLHMAVLTGIRKKGEFRGYYNRKINEGKHKMSVLNAIRNKLILRIFACVRENRLYQKKIEE